MKKKLLILLVALMVLFTIGVGFLSYLNLLPKTAYSAEHFGITTLVSKIDCDKDGIDDYADIMLGARAYVQTKPRYKSTYYANGYPPDGEGVCTDVIWKAFQNAGYSLKDLVDADIAANIAAYPRVEGKPDPGIDFRRVKNLQVFFERNATSLPIETTNIAAWQPGDIVVYASSHIAIVSDLRNKDGLPYIIHHGGQPVLEEDALTRDKICGHYRWDMSITHQPAK